MEVVHVEAVGAVELLATVFVGLDAGVVVSVGHAVGVVAVALHDVARLVKHRPDVALIVPDVIVVIVAVCSVRHGIAVVSQDMLIAFFIHNN